MTLLEGSIQTVTGLISPEDSGFTLPVEHLLSDPTINWTPPAEASARDLYFAELSNETIAYSRYYGLKNLSVGRLGNINNAIDEVDLFKEWGGGSVVDTTGSAGGRDPVGLMRIANTTEINVVMTATAPATNGIDSESPETSHEMAETIISEITTGANGTQVKAGVISNDNGDGRSHTDLETLQACAIAHRATGAPIFVDASASHDEPHTVLEALNELGVDSTAVSFLHMGGHPRSTLKAVAESGGKVALDDFGHGIQPASDYTYAGNSSAKSSVTSDESMLSTLEWLVSDGHGDQVLVSQNINSADRYTKYGGHGYFFLLANVIPRMRAMGFGDDMIEKLFVSNPADALRFRAPSLSIK